MGVIYRATQVALGRPVAVKAIAPQFAEDEEFRERFKREAHIAASIEHPNVIPVYEAGELDGTLYLIMRWVDGTDLRKLVSAEGRLSPSRALGLLRPVALALSAAHRRGLVHRDVKPANVLITHDGQDDEHVYLTDFGIARRTDAEGMTRTGLLVGTLDYTSPERLEGAKGGPTDDIYSYGCMLFEALTGHVPYERPSDVAKIFAHINQAVPSARAEVEGIPEQLDALIRKAMAKRPEDRFASAAELALAAERTQSDLDARDRALTARRTRPSPTTDVTEVGPVAAAGAQGAAEITAPAATRPAGGGQHAGQTAPAARDTRGAAAPPSPAPSTQSATRPAHPAPDTQGATRPAPPAPDTQGATRQPAPPRRDRVTRRRAWLAIPLVLLVAAVVAVVLIAGGGGTSQPQPQALARGAGLSVSETIGLGGTPGALSVGPSGAVWVSLPGSRAVAHVNPRTKAITTYSVPARPTAIAAGVHGIWVGSAGGSLTRLNLATGSAAASAQLSAGIVAVTVDQNDGSAWAADGTGNVTHLDLDGHTVAAPTPVSPAPVALGWGEDWVWAVNGATDGLVRVSLAGGASSTAFDTQPGAVSVAFDAGVWTAHSDGIVTRFDPRPTRLTVNGAVTVAPSLDQIAAMEQYPSVWAISAQAKSLYRISARAASPSITGTITFNSPPVALAAGGPVVWVATQAGNLVEIVSS